jgi:hypothetical protein
MFKISEMKNAIIAATFVFAFTGCDAESNNTTTTPSTSEEEIKAITYIKNEFNISNPNPRKIDLISMMSGNPGIFVYQNEGLKYLIVPGVSDADRTIRENAPRGKTFVFYKDHKSWSTYTIEEDIASTWTIRNFDSNSDFFILGDANEIGLNWQDWAGDIIKGVPNNGKITWSRVNTETEMGFYHDVSLGNLNSDGITDILGVGFNVFMGNHSGYSFQDGASLFEYNFNRPFAFELYDLDNDGIDELISADYHEEYGTLQSNRISIHKLNSQDQKFKQVFTSKDSKAFFNEDRGATSIYVEDFNNDGLVDISVAREVSGSESFEVWLNNDNFNFSPHFSKEFSCNEFNFLEYEVMDANLDGYLDIILRPETCGGIPTSSFQFSSYSEYGKGIQLNDCIWLNDGNAKFYKYTQKELTTPIWVNYLYPYMENNKLHFVGFEYDELFYNEIDNSLKVNIVDFEINF